MSRRSEFEDAIHAEVEQWPGVTVRIEEGGKHPAAALTFDGVSVRQPFSGTPSDMRYGKHRMLGDVRRAMKMIGAARAKASEDDGPDVRLEFHKPVDRSGVKAKAELVEREPVTQTDPRDVLAAIAPPQAEGPALPQPDIPASKAAAVSDEEAPKTIRNAAEATKEREAALAALQARIDAIEDGVYFGLPDTVYHAVPRLSSSGIQKLIVSPGTFWKGSWLDPEKAELDDEQTKAQMLGKAYHCARLEPEAFEERYIRELAKEDFAGDDTVWNATEIGEALAELGQAKKKAGEGVGDQAMRLKLAGYEGAIWPLEQAQWKSTTGKRIPIPAKFWDDIVTDMERLKGCGPIAAMLTDGAAEVSIFWTDEHGLKMKARTDYLKPELWADFKTFDNSRGKVLEQAISDAIRYNRYYVQATIYRAATEAIRTGGLQIIGEATDAQRTLIAAIQIQPDPLRCWFVFQEKGGIPNLLGRLFKFYDADQMHKATWDAGMEPEELAKAHKAVGGKTQIYQRGLAEIFRAKKTFADYSQVYKPGQPWFPFEPMGTIDDVDFSNYWLEHGL